MRIVERGIMRILITGTPGTGKTSVGKELAERMGAPFLRIADVAKKEGIVKGGEVDVKALRAALLKRMRGNLVVEGHLGCEFSLPVDFVFVLRTHPSILEQRMKGRRYPEKKRKENLLSEMLDYCLQLSEKHYNVPVLQVDTSRGTPSRSAGRIEKFLKGKVKKLDRVDWGKELRKKTKGALQ